MSTDATSETLPPQMTVLSQYVRSVSFNNDAAQQGANPSGRPNINVQVNVDAKAAEDGRYAVTLKTKVVAKTEEMTAFSVDLDYVGIFQLTNVPEEHAQRVLLIECPRLLFPFARRIIAEVTRDGGYPPLLLDPIDFAALYARQSADAANAATA